MSAPRTRPYIRALLVDISGNLYVGKTPTVNAVDTFNRLRASHIPFRLCSNTSKESTASLVRRLRMMGFQVQEEPLLPSDGGDPRRQRSRREVWTSIGALAQYVKDHGFQRPYFLLSQSAKEEILSTGVVDLLNNPELSYDSVVVGLVPQLFDYHHLNTAFRILKGENASARPPGNSTSFGVEELVQPGGNIPLIVTHKAKYIQTESPPGLSLGPGPFITALENATGVQAHVIGKPTGLFYQTVIDDFYSSGELSRTEGLGRIAVIGDDVEADLGDGAVKKGLWRILDGGPGQLVSSDCVTIDYCFCTVKTGKYREGDERKPGVQPPDEVFDSFATFVESLLSGHPKL